MELGIYSFVDYDPAALNAGTIRMKELMEEIILADELGLDVFGVGEHHRKEYLASAPAVILAAAASVTKKIKLTSAVTVLSSDDPVRVFQEFSTLDLISGGRAEIMAGRGSFIESFPLFGYDLGDYDELFSEKLDLLLRINDSEKISWNGKMRASINNLGIYPRPQNEKLPVWIAVGGTPQSAIRAGKLGLPLALAIIGGSPKQFVPFIELYRESAEKAGNSLKAKVGINSHVFVGDDSATAALDFYPGYADAMTKIGKERGWSGMSREHYESMRTVGGALLVGSTQEVIDKILYEYELFGNDRFLAQMTVGVIPHKKIMHSMELFGTVVAPAIRKALKK
jgi:probable LLM family oxidoreductase